MRRDALKAFVKESNKIEGIVRPATIGEVLAHQKLLGCNTLFHTDLVAFVENIEPGHVLRDQSGLNVRVGDHVAPPGGSKVLDSLVEILNAVNGLEDPYDVHHRYETLHPFTDGNGRSGRALWLWMMQRGSDQQRAMSAELGFLHCWYYQSLAAGDGRQRKRPGMEG